MDKFRIASIVAKVFGAKNATLAACVSQCALCLACFWLCLLPKLAKNLMLIFNHLQKTLKILSKKWFKNLERIRKCSTFASAFENNGSQLQSKYCCRAVTAAF